MTTASGEAAELILDGATYRYAGTGRAALRDVSLTLRPGRVVGVAGANEAGKSTLCLVASGLAPAAIGGRLEGSVSIDGTLTAGLRAHDLAHRCGVMFQDPMAQLSNAAVTVFEEVAFGPTNLGLPVREVLDRVNAALAMAGIEALAGRDPAHLSGGQVQLVALASVLAMRPRYLILDEPTSELDPAGTALVADALARVAAETDAGILLVEHKTDVLTRIADEVVVLAEGSVALRGPAAQVLADPRLPDLGVEPPAAAVLPAPLAAAGFELADVFGRTDDFGRKDPVEPAPAGRTPPAVGRPVAVEPAPHAGSTSGVPSIECEGVAFTYPGGTQALTGVDLRIEPGEAVAIVGRNGSGKSTLVRQLNGLLRPTAGRVAIDGVDIAGRRVARLAGIVGLAFQNPDRQLFARSVRAEVEFGPRNLGVRGSELDERVREALAAVGLAGELDTHPYDLGFSRRKLLALASVLAMRTPILILDEPTTGQDARGVARIRSVVAGALAEGRSVIAVSHDMRFVAQSFGRVVALRDGRVVLDARTR